MSRGKARLPPTAEMLVGEIARARRFLGNPPDEKTLEELREAGVLQLLQEAQIVGAAVELRQKTDIAENVEAAIAAERAKRTPWGGPLPQ